MVLKIESIIECGWYTKINDVDGSVIIEGEVFVKWSIIFKKEKQKLLLYLLVKL